MFQFAEVHVGQIVEVPGDSPNARSPGTRVILLEVKGKHRTHTLDSCIASTHLTRKADEHR